MKKELGKIKRNMACGEIVFEEDLETDDGMDGLFARGARRGEILKMIRLLKTIMGTEDEKSYERMIIAQLEDIADRPLSSYSVNVDNLGHPLREYEK